MTSPALNTISWDTFNGLGMHEKASYLMEDGRPRHVLLPQQFGRTELDALGALATLIRLIAKDRQGVNFLSQLMDDKRAMLYFTQPSTRTFLSHLSACQILGMKAGEVRDTATSSELKGESREDSVRTFSSYYDLIIMRTKERGLAERMAWVLGNSDRPIPIINAGSGQDQHPTQALLDVYTLQRSFEEQGGIEGKHIVFVGDLARGRTVRSLATLLVNYDDVLMSFVAPEAFQIDADILIMLDSHGLKYECSSDMRGAIATADAVYMTRIQDEWDTEEGESAKVDTSSYCLTAKDLDAMKSSAIIMHPLPRREEVPTEIDRDPRAMYWRQMRNGMWVRSALIAQLFRRDDDIRRYKENDE